MFLHTESDGRCPGWFESSLDAQNFVGFVKLWLRLYTSMHKSVNTLLSNNSLFDGQL